VDRGGRALRAAAQQPTPRSATPACLVGGRAGAAAPLAVVVCLGAFAWDAALRLRAAAGVPAPRPRPRFGHGRVLRRRRLAAARRDFPPVTAEHVHRPPDAAMLDDVLAHAQALAAGSDPQWTRSLPSPR
jgi:uracil-DNA glycosylase